MHIFTIYTKPTCPYCIRAKALLSDLQASGNLFKVKDVSINTPELIEEMLEKSGGRKTVPQVFLDDMHIGGYDDLYKAHVSGKLAELLVSEIS